MPKPDSNFILQVSPNILDFNTVGLSENSEMEAVIRNITTTDLDIKIVDMPSEFIDAKLSSKKVKPSQEVRLKVKITGKAKSANLTKSITLELGDQNKSRFTIPIRK